MAGGGLAYRFWVILVNLILPPLAVALLAGVDVDFLINCTLFLLAVIPSHIHGFYISMVYFHRRKKVRKGQYPGGSKAFIFSKSVLNGGASDAEEQSGKPDKEQSWESDEKQEQGQQTSSVWKCAWTSSSTLDGCC
ncbi:hypothetical protein KC316_g14154 [Hortaea werneckii]|nr:hypothetical protein KC324_g13393 [Hortaea werneckii]KAI7551623.1 hypothetical protein KC316_g14154 [Hortaea werneckii]